MCKHHRWLCSMIIEESLRNKGCRWRRGQALRAKQLDPGNWMRFEKRPTCVWDHGLGGGDESTWQWARLKSINWGHEPEGKGEWETERYELSGDPRDEDEELEREWRLGSYNVTEVDTYSGSSSSRILCSSLTMVSRSIWVRVLPFPSSYSHPSAFLAFVHCWQAGFKPSHL